jgi:glycosyltransferase involved in cell wall biosynthesis
MKVAESTGKWLTIRANLPLVSCLMPTGDRPEFAALAIRRFLAQDYPAIELVIVDDGSSPLPAGLVADTRIRYIRLAERQSTGAKRNRACREARGRVLMQWDDDDWHGASRIRRQVEPLLAGRAEITGLADTLMLDLARLELWQPSSASFRRLAFAGVHCGTLAYRREVSDRLTCYPDVSLGEDVAFLRPALAAGCRVAPVPAGHDFVYVRHGKNTSNYQEFFQRFAAHKVPMPRAIAADLPHYRELQRWATRQPEFRATPPKRGLSRPPEQVNSRGIHRSGWRDAFEALARLDLPLLLDDFVEQTFSYPAENDRPTIHAAPWVGIFHCPPSMPNFAVRRQHPQYFLSSPGFVASRQHLRGAVALSQYLGDWLADRLQVPVLVVKHPTASARLWSPESLRAGRDLTLLQIGFYLRNTLAIDQIPPQPGIRRARLAPHTTRAWWVKDWHQAVVRHWQRFGTRRTWPGVGLVPCATNDEYDALLASSIVLTEVFDASANNVVVECLARGTPLVVNRHPAVVEYVGADYPLLFDRIGDVAGLIADRQRILAAHEQLLTRRGDWLDADVFASQIGEFCHRVAGT